MITGDDINLFLLQNKAFFYEQFNLTKIGYFGSYARGEQNETSDIDIIVEFKENTSDLYDKKLKLKEFIQTSFNTKVDICREKAIKPIFRELILSDAIYV